MEVRGWDCNHPSCFSFTTEEFGVLQLLSGSKRATKSEEYSYAIGINECIFATRVSSGSGKTRELKC